MPESLQFHPDLHNGPWSELDFLQLPEDRRELIDGELVVSPHPTRAHQRLSSRLWQALSTACPAHLEVLEAINVRVGPDRILIPDLAVVTDPGADDLVTDASSVVLVVEIVSPGSLAADRVLKPGLYATAGIPSYLRVNDPRGPAAVMFDLEAGRYVRTAHADSGGRIRITDPFAVTLDLGRSSRPDPV